METINCGLLADIKNLISSISQSLAKLLQSNDFKGVLIEKQEKLENNGVRLTCRSNNERFVITMEPIMKEGSTPEEQKPTGNVRLLIQYGNNKKAEIKSIKQSDVGEKVRKFLHSNIDGFGEVESSKKLMVTLHKIESKKDIAVNLTAIKSSYTIPESNELLDIVLDNEGFIDSIPLDCPVSYEITDNYDNIDVNESEWIDSTEYIDEILSLGLNILCIAKSVSWKYHSILSDRSYQCLNTLKYEINEELDIIGMYAHESLSYDADLTLCSDCSSNICNMAECICEDDTCIKELLTSLIDTWTECLDFYYPNFRHESQYMIDGWLVLWHNTKIQYL